jgi:hypothetical protein
MKKIVVGLAMASMCLGVVSIPTIAPVAGDSPVCSVLLSLPPLPVTLPPQATGGSRCDPKG